MLGALSVVVTLGAAINGAQAWTFEKDTRYQGGNLVRFQTTGTKAVQDCAEECCNQVQGPVTPLDDGSTRWIKPDSFTFYHENTWCYCKKYSHAAVKDHTDAISGKCPRRLEASTVVDDEFE